MSSKGKGTAARRAATGRPRPGAASPKPVIPADRRARIGLLVAVLVLAAAAVLGADFAFGAIWGGSSQGNPTAQSAQSNWTNVSANQLAEMLQHKDFTLLNVKTPYSNEIDGTDLYIPYDQLTARASELPADKGAKILVYCLTGHSSAIAAQTLLNLGYTNVWNLDGGMTAWTASGRTLVNKNR
jgi:rhodanese-related sulfurtransferase